MPVLSEYEHIVLTEVEVSKLLSPLVYILYRDEIPVWIGGSKYGLGRFTEGEIKPNLDWNRIKLVFCEQSQVNSLVKEIEDELKPEIPNKNRNAGTSLESQADRIERIEEKRKEAAIRDEALDKLTEEALKQRWKMR